MGIVAVEVVECVVVVDKVGEQALEQDDEADEEVEAADGE